MIACAVCSDTYAPGLGFSCHKCEGPSGESAKAVGGIVFVVVVVIVALILMDFAGFIGDDGVEDADEAKPRTCKRGINWVSSVIAKSVPLTALKTVIVVWQIITQVSCALKVSDKPGRVDQVARGHLLTGGNPMEVESR